MKKVFVNLKLNDNQKERLENISEELKMVYEPEEDVEIIVGNYAPSEMKNFPNLKWFQASAVGVDNYVKKGILNDDVVMTNAVDIHSTEVAQHVFATMLTMVKKLYLYRDDQSKALWTDEGKVKDLSKLRVAIVGFGDIGKNLARQCKALGMYVIGVKRTMVDKPDYIDELYTNDHMLEAIRDVDVVVTLLPGIPENVGLFTVDTFKAMRKDAILINAGRGNLYTEETLKEVLDNKIIEAVAMDVFIKEPLDSDSLLWQYRNLVITPHVAGFFHVDSALEDFLDLVEENLKRYLNNEELKYVVSEREK